MKDSFPRKRFWSLKAGETFFLGSRRMMKSGIPWFLGGNCFELSASEIVYEIVWPWTRVHTTQLIQDARPSPLAKLAERDSKRLSEKIGRWLKYRPTS